jgi:ribonuclease Z
MSVITPGGIRVTGAWTRAGLGSCVRVEGANKGDDILFDCGVCEPECLKAGFVFISHGHMDHIGASVLHARAKMLTSKPSIYYVPVESVEPLNEARVAFSKMDGKDIIMNIVPLKPGDVVTVNSDLVVKVFPTIHRVQSQGYALYKRSNGSLLPQFHNLPGKEIGELKRNGVKITSDNVETLELVYTGDTIFSGLIQECNMFIFDAPILIMELTYLDGDKQKSIDRGHVHLDDVVDNMSIFNNQQIVFVHLSERYGPFGKALMMLRDKLPSEILIKSLVSLRSFGSGEHLTRIANVDWNKRRAEVGWGWGRQVDTSHSSSSHNHGGRGRGIEGRGYSHNQVTVSSSSSSQANSNGMNNSGNFANSNSNNPNPNSNNMNNFMVDNGGGWNNGGSRNRGTGGRNPYLGRGGRRGGRHR